MKTASSTRCMWPTARPCAPATSCCELANPALQTQLERQTARVAALEAELVQALPGGAGAPATPDNGDARAGDAQAELAQRTGRTRALARTRGRADGARPGAPAAWRCRRPPICPATTCGAAACSARCWATRRRRVRVALPESDAGELASRRTRVSVRLAASPAPGACRAVPAAHGAGAVRQLPSAALSQRHGGPVPTDPQDKDDLKPVQPVVLLDVQLAAAGPTTRRAWANGPGCGWTPASRRWPGSCAQALRRELRAATSTRSSERRHSLAAPSHTTGRTMATLTDQAHLLPCPARSGAPTRCAPPTTPHRPGAGRTGPACCGRRCRRRAARRAWRADSANAWPDLHEPQRQHALQAVRQRLRRDGLAAAAVAQALGAGGGLCRADAGPDPATDTVDRRRRLARPAHGRDGHRRRQDAGPGPGRRGGRPGRHAGARGHRQRLPGRARRRRSWRRCTPALGLRVVALPANSAGADDAARRDAYGARHRLRHRTRTGLRLPARPPGPGAHQPAEHVAAALAGARPRRSRCCAACAWRCSTRPTASCSTRPTCR